MAIYEDSYNETLKRVYNTNHELRQRFEAVCGDMYRIGGAIVALGEYLDNAPDSETAADVARLRADMFNGLRNAMGAAFMTDEVKDGLRYNPDRDLGI